MFRHVVLLTFNEGTTKAAAGNASLAVVAEFDDQAGYQAYATNAVHLKVIAEAIKPVLSARSAVQFDDD